MTTTDDVAAAQKAATEAVAAAKQAKSDAEKAKRETEAQAKIDAKQAKKDREASNKANATVPVQPPPMVSSGDAKNKAKDKGDWAML